MIPVRGVLTQVGERPKEPCSNHRNIRHTALVRAAKDLRKLSVRSHGHDHSRTDPAVRVASRPSRDENACVDDGRQGADSSLLDGNNPRRAVCVARARNEIRVARVDNKSDQQGTEDVEEADAVRNTASSSWDGAVGIHRLCSTDDNSLNTNEREGGVDKGGEEAEEVASRSLDSIVLDPGAGVVPVPESNRLAAGTSAGRDDNSDDDEAYKADDLDSSSDDFCFSVESDIAEVNGQDQDE